MYALSLRTFKLMPSPFSSFCKESSDWYFNPVSYNYKQITKNFQYRWNSFFFREGCRLGTKSSKKYKSTKAVGYWNFSEHKKKKTLRKVRKIKKKSATTVGSRLVSAFKDFLSLNLVHYSISKSKKNKFQTII